MTYKLQTDYKRGAGNLSLISNISTFVCMCVHVFVYVSVCMCMYVCLSNDIAMHFSSMVN